MFLYSVFVNMFLFLLDKYSLVWLLDCMAIECLVLNCQTVFQMTMSLFIPNLCQHLVLSLFLILSILVCIVISHSGFNLHILNG